jgi:hypothetical protein
LRIYCENSLKLAAVLSNTIWSLCKERVSNDKGGKEFLVLNSEVNVL